jgi:hypothetical protein
MAGHESVIIPPTTPSKKWLEAQVESPELAVGTIQKPFKQLVQEEELLQPGTAQIPITPKAEREPIAPAVAQDAVAQDAVVQAAAQQEDIEVATVQEDEAVAKTGTVPPEATVRGQLEQLMGDVESGDAPWADEAMRKANQAMSARGMGSSSIAAAAITQSVLEAAMPIAKYDAGVYGTINLQNLRNQQEAMLSTYAASNVAKNLNAKSINEVSRFMAGLRQGIITYNSTQYNEMSKYNATEANRIAAQNAGNTTEVSKQNAIQRNQMTAMHVQENNKIEKFNSDNAIQIARSNAEWRRATNTMNTAADNAANSQNTSNLFNISEQAKANLWQQSADVFDWANKNGESEKDRAYNLVQYSIQRNDFLQDLKAADKKALEEQMGDFVLKVFEELAKNKGWLG